MFLKLGKCPKGPCHLSQESPWHWSESKCSEWLSDGGKPTGPDRQEWLHDESHWGLTWVVRRKQLLRGIFWIQWCLHFPINCVLPGEGTTIHGWWPLPFILPPDRETETGYFDPITMDICPPRTFECAACFVTSPFLLLYIHSTSQPP